MFHATKKLIFLSLLCVAWPCVVDAVKGGSESEKSFNSLEGEEVLDAPVNVDANLSSFEDRIIRYLVFLGASSNKQITFITIGLGVLIAILFPRQTKSLVHSTGRRMKIYLTEIKKNFHFLEGKIKSWR